MSFSHSFEKYIYLPSGGIKYPSDAWMLPATNELFMLSVDHNINTEFEYITQLIKKYTKLPVDIKELFLFDFYYLYYIMKVVFIKGKTNEIIILGCHNCEHKQKVNIELSDLIIRLNNKFSLPDYIINIGEYEIEFNLRTVQNNLQFPYITMNYENNFHKIITYIWQQIKQIKHNNKIILKEYYYDIINNIPLKRLLDIFVNLNEYNKIYGIYDSIKFTCNKCETENDFTLFNDISLCTIQVKGKLNNFDMMNYYKNILHLLQLKILNVNDYKSIPYKDVDNFFGAFGQLDFKISQRMI